MNPASPALRVCPFAKIKRNIRQGVHLNHQVGSKIRAFDWHPLIEHRSIIPS